MQHYANTKSHIGLCCHFVVDIVPAKQRREEGTCFTPTQLSQTY